MNINLFRRQVLRLCLILSLLWLPELIHTDGMTVLAAAAVPPRAETLYFNGLQWGPVVGWNPYSNSNNNAMAIAQQDNARVTMFETPYVYNMLDGKVYPLLADGPWSWNRNGTALTFRINKAARWSDGSPVTAADVVYTWATNVKYNTAAGGSYQDYIAAITALDRADSPGQGQVGCGWQTAQSSAGTGLPQQQLCNPEGLDEKARSTHPQGCCKTPGRSCGRCCVFRPIPQIDSR